MTRPFFHQSICDTAGVSAIFCTIHDICGLLCTLCFIILWRMSLPFAYLKKMILPEGIFQSLALTEAYGKNRAVRQGADALLSINGTDIICVYKDSPVCGKKAGIVPCKRKKTAEGHAAAEAFSASDLYIQIMCVADN